MAIFECIKNTTYGKIDYGIGDEMEMNDSVLAVIHHDKIVSQCFRLKTEMPEPEKEPVKKPIAMSDQNDMKAAAELAWKVPAPKKKEEGQE